MSIASVIAATSPPPPEHLYFRVGYNVIGPVCDKVSRAGDSHDIFRKEHRRMRSVKETLIDLREQQKVAAERVPPAAAFPVRPLAQVIPLTPRDSKRR